MFYIHDDVINALVIVALSPAEDSGEVIPRTQGKDTNVRRTLGKQKKNTLWLHLNMYMYILLAIPRSIKTIVLHSNSVNNK